MWYFNYSDIVAHINIYTFVIKNVNESQNQKNLPVTDYFIKGGENEIFNDRV